MPSGERDKLDKPTSNMALTSLEEIQANNLLQATPLEHRNRLVKGLGQYFDKF
jgi:hypothetical protein